MSFLRDLLHPGRRAVDLLGTEGWGSFGGSSLDASLAGESRRTAAGEDVTQEKALSLVAYFAALRNISQDVAKLPRQLRKRRATRGSDIETAHPASSLIVRQPNPLMGGHTFVQLLQFRALGWGNGYAEIVRDATGKPRELWPIHPRRVRPVVLEDGRTLEYDVLRGPGQEPMPMEARDIFHVKSIGNGIEGLSLIRVGSEVLGLGLAAQKNAAHFSAGMAKRVAVFSKVQLGAAGRKALRQRILEDKQLDPEGRRKLPIIEGDYTLGDMGIPPEDAQLLQTREFTTEEVARLVRIALTKIQYHKRAQGWNSLELLNTDHATDTLLPWCMTWQEECSLKLLEPNEQEAYFWKWVMQGLLRGDTAARTAYYNSGLDRGWLSPNDVRDFEDLNPIDKPEADNYKVQGQMRTLEQVGSQPEAAASPAGPAAQAKPPVEEADEEEAEGREARDQRERAAFEPIVLAAAERVANKEAHALARSLKAQAGNQVAFDTWAQRFYAQLLEEAVAAFAPVTLAVSGATRRRVLPVEGVLRAELSPAAGSSWAAYCRPVAAGTCDARAGALATLVLDHLFKEAPDA